MVFENDKIQFQIKNFNGLDLFSVPGLIIDLRKQPQNQFVITFYAPITSSFQLCSGFFASCDDWRSLAKSTLCSLLYYRIRWPRPWSTYATHTTLTAQNKCLLMLYILQVQPHFIFQSIIFFNLRNTLYIIHNKVVWVLVVLITTIIASYIHS